MHALAQVRRLRDALALAADEVVGLEGRKAALQAGLAERRHEVEVHRDSLRTQLKLVRDDIHRCARGRAHGESALLACVLLLGGRGLVSAGCVRA